MLQRGCFHQHYRWVSTAAESKPRLLKVSLSCYFLPTWHIEHLLFHFWHLQFDDKHLLFIEVAGELCGEKLKITHTHLIHCERAVFKHTFKHRLWHKSFYANFTTFHPFDQHEHEIQNAQVNVRFGPRTCLLFKQGPKQFLASVLASQENTQTHIALFLLLLCTCGWMLKNILFLSNFFTLAKATVKLCETVDLMAFLEEAPHHGP